MGYLLGVVLGCFFLSSSTIFFFLVFLTYGVLCANSAATIVFDFEEDNKFVTWMEVAIFVAIFMMFFLSQKAVYYVIHKSDSDEELKTDLDNFREMQSASRGMYDDGSAIHNSDTKQAYDEVLDAVQDLQAELEDRKDSLSKGCNAIRSNLADLKEKIIEREKEQTCGIDWIPAARKKFSYLCAIMIILCAIAFLFKFCVARRQVEPSPGDLQKKNRTLHFQDLYLHRELPSKDRNKIQFEDTHTCSACQMRWGDLSALDHAILAKVAYYQPELLGQNLTAKADLEALKRVLNFTFPTTLGYDVSLVEDWETNEQRKEDAQGGKFSKYYRFDFKGRKHTVVAVQGTNTTDPRDLFTDLRLWFVSALMDIAEWIIMLFNFLLPHQRGDLQWLIDWVHEHMTIHEGKVGETMCGDPVLA